MQKRARKYLKIACKWLQIQQYQNRGQLGLQKDSTGYWRDTEETDQRQNTKETEEALTKYAKHIKSWNKTD